MLTLILNIVLLVIGAGGSIVSSLALNNPRARRWFIIGFGLMGALGLVLTIITYENTPDVPHIGEALADLKQFISSFGHTHLWIWTFLCLVVGLATGAYIVRFLPKREYKDKTAPSVKEWLDPLAAIETYADPQLRAQRDSDRKKSESLKVQIDLLNQKFNDEVQQLHSGQPPTTIQNWSQS